MKHPTETSGRAAAETLRGNMPVREIRVDLREPARIMTAVRRGGKHQDRATNAGNR
jgi:hypothetical protein